MGEDGRCRRCGAETGGAGDGACPACVLGLLMVEEEEAGDEVGVTIEETAYRDHGLVVLGRVDQGGGGVVYEAEQTPLGRVVALKVLREEHRDDPVRCRRFEEEARIGSRLQHPGIVPVYQSGTLGGRPFFTMRRVGGKSLAAVLAEEPRSPRLIGIFLQVCQTLAYAHDRGVIHRDLKPANIMVGDFGEVMLLDWGLARERGADPDETPPLFARESAPDGETPGSGPVMGTPAYMAPEQARGEVGRIDERSDVFGLGALLCEILTGLPPYTGATGQEVRRKAREADLAEALSRLNAVEADGDLVALARACLDPDPTRRPAGAGEVAEAVSAYQAGVEGRLRAAEQARWRAEGKAAEERKRWGVTLLLVAVSAVAGLWYIGDRYDRSRKERDRERAIDRMFEEADRLRAAGRSAEVRLAARAVEGLLPEADEAVRRRARAKLADLDTLMQLEEARYSAGRAGERGLLGSRASAYAAAFRRYEIDPARLDPAEVARRVREQPIRADLVVALDDWALAARDPDLKKRLRQAAADADPDPDGPRARLRKALVARDRPALVALAGSPGLAGQPASVLVGLGGTLREVGARDEAAKVLREAQQSHPSDFLVNLELAATLESLTPPAADAEDYLTAALALSQRNPAVYLYWGQVQHAVGRFEAAVASYRKALAIRPDYPEALNSLGNSLTSLGKIKEAIASFDRAIVLQPDFELTYFNLGYALDEQQKYGEAADAYRKAVALRPDYAEAQCNLGFAEYRDGLFAPAVADLDRGIARLSPTDPLRPRFESYVAMGRSLAALEPKLNAALEGKSGPADVSETVGFARLCNWRNRELHARAARYYAEAFEASPALAEDLVVGDRYAAANSAAMAGVGRGKDAAGLTESERVSCRRLALRWLRADLDRRAKVVAGNDLAARTDAIRRLHYWSRDPNFAGVRDPESLASLPADERDAWKALWADHARLIAPTSPKGGLSPQGATR